MKKTLLILGLSLMTLLSACSFSESESPELVGTTDGVEDPESSMLNPDLKGDEIFYIQGDSDCSPDGTYPFSYNEEWNEYKFELPYCWSVEEVATDMLYFYSAGSEEEILFIGPGELEEESTSSYESGSITVAGESWEFYTDDPNTTKVSTVISSFVNMNPSEEFEEPEYEIPEELLEDKVTRPTEDEQSSSGDITVQFEGIEFLLNENQYQCMMYSKLTIWGFQVEGYEINEEQRIWDCIQYGLDNPSNQMADIMLWMTTSKADIEAEIKSNEGNVITSSEFVENEWGSYTALIYDSYLSIEDTPPEFTSYDILVEFNEVDSYLMLRGSIDQNSIQSYKDALSLIDTISIQ